MLDTQAISSDNYRMNKLPLEKRVQILSMLVEGSSMRSISRVADVSINTVSKLLVDTGTACLAYHDENVRRLNCQRVQCDEIWSFVGSKEKNVPKEKKGTLEQGDVWTWTAIDADSKLICSYLVGGRDAGYAHTFMQDVASRLTNRVQLTADGHKPYLQAVGEAFNNQIDFAQLIKHYGQPADSTDRLRYSPAECSGASIGKTIGKHDYDHVSTSYVERQNLSMRMGMRRFTRLTNAFSKKFEYHVHAIALYFVVYNFVRIHKTVKVTPAMQAGVTDKLWSMAVVANMIEANEPAPAKRGPYKKQISN